MGDLLSVLGLAGVAGAKAQTANLEGQQIKREREQKDLLQRLAMERQATQDAEDAKRSDLLNRLTETQINKANAPEPTRNIDDLSPEGIAAAVERERQLQAVRQGPQSGKTYEERKENGGEAIYEDGKFKTWKIRPPVERDKSIGDALEANRQFQREQSLRQDFQQEPVVKQAGALASAVAQLRASAQQKTPQGDLNMLYGAVKLRDPNAVREGELALNNKARSANTQMFALWDRVASGRILTDEERQQVMDLVEQTIQEQTRLIQPIQRMFGEKSRMYGADSSFVARDPFEGVRSTGNVTTSTGRTFQKVNP